MISDQQRDILKKGLPFRYTKAVKAILREKKIFKDEIDGSEYSAAYITNVFNGEYEHQGIEMAICELYDRTVALKEKAKDMMEKITKKPRAATPGSI